MGWCCDQELPLNIILKDQLRHLSNNPIWEIEKWCEDKIIRVS